jgi:hypothetical protein
MNGNAFFRNAMSPLSWYCSHMYIDSSGPLVMSSAFQFGEPGSLHPEFAPLPGSPPLPLNRMTSGTQAPGRPPICCLVQASMFDRSLMYMSKIGMLSW